MKHTGTMQRVVLPVLIGSLCVIGLLIGPAATSLQLRTQWTREDATIDAIYLVCGARAQSRRLHALHEWLHTNHPERMTIWIGNDTQNSLWSRRHERNLTRAELAHQYCLDHFPQHQATILPGAFTNTDGEMAALARMLINTPEMETIALVTCAFHARRSVRRLHAHLPFFRQLVIIPVTPHWENRAPWIVLAEWLKIVRDELHLSQHPWLSRQPESHAVPTLP